MIQISLEKIRELYAKSGQDLADFPDQAAQIMQMNEQLAAHPEFDTNMFFELLNAVMSSVSDAPVEDLIDRRTSIQKALDELGWTEGE